MKRSLRATQSAVCRSAASFWAGEYVSKCRQFASWKVQTSGPEMSGTSARCGHATCTRSASAAASASVACSVSAEAATTCTPRSSRSLWPSENAVPGAETATSVTSTSGATAAMPRASSRTNRSPPPPLACRLPITSRRVRVPALLGAVDAAGDVTAAAAGAHDSVWTAVRAASPSARGRAWSRAAKIAWPSATGRGSARRQRAPLARRWSWTNGPSTQTRGSPVASASRRTAPCPSVPSVTTRSEAPSTASRQSPTATTSSPGSSIHRAASPPRWATAAACGPLTAICRRRPASRTAAMASSASA